MQVRVGHIYREANQCADLLAKRGCTMEENFVVFDSLPSADMYILFNSNKNGLYHYRHVPNTLASVGRL